MKREVLREKPQPESLGAPPSPLSSFVGSEGSSPSSSDKENQEPVYPLAKPSWKAPLNEISSPEILKKLSGRLGRKQ